MYIFYRFIAFLECIRSYTRTFSWGDKLCFLQMQDWVISLFTFIAGLKAVDFLEIYTGKSMTWMAFLLPETKARKITCTEVFFRYYDCGKTLFEYHYESYTDQERDLLCNQSALWANSWIDTCSLKIHWKSVAKIVCLGVIWFSC